MLWFYSIKNHAWKTIHAHLRGKSSEGKGKLPTGQAVADITCPGRGSGPGRRPHNSRPPAGPSRAPLPAAPTRAPRQRGAPAWPPLPRGRRSCGGGRPRPAGRAEPSLSPILTAARLHRHRRLRNAVPGGLPESRCRPAAAVRVGVRVRVQARANPRRRHLEGATAAGNAGRCSPAGRPRSMLGTVVHQGCLRQDVRHGHLQVFPTCGFLTSPWKRPSEGCAHRKNGGAVARSSPNQESPRVSI